MNGERIDAEIAGLLEEVRPELSPSLEERAVGAILAARPARARLRRRGTAIAAAAVLLLGLGFVPVPMGPAKGALNTALAMADQSLGVHISGHVWTPAGEYDFEEWYAPDGFMRYDLYDGNTLVGRWLTDPEERFVYPRSGETEPEHRYQRLLEEGQVLPPRAREYVRGSLLGPGVGIPADAALDVSPSARAIHESPNEDELRERLSWRRVEFEWDVRERLERSLWRGAVVVAEAQGECKGSGEPPSAAIVGDLNYPLAEFYEPGDQIRVRAEIEPQTGAILALEQYKGKAGVWTPVYRTDLVERDIEIDKTVRDAEAPPNHTEVRDNWWRARLPHVLAAGTSENWQFILNAMDLNRRGELFVTLSRKPRPGSAYAEPRESRRLRPISAYAVDNFGVRYSIAETAKTWVDRADFIEGFPDRVVFGVPECHVRLRLVREQSPIPQSVVRTVTVVATSSSPGETETSWESVRLAGLALPSPQPGEDLIAEGIATTKR